MGTYLQHFGSSFNQGSSRSGEAYSPEARARINALYPELMRRLGGTGGGGGSAGVGVRGSAGPAGGGSATGQSGFQAVFNQVGGTPTPFPEVTVGPIWDDNQIQSRVNLARAQGDASVASKAQELERSFAGRGFGANSALSQALATSLYGQNLAAQAAAENDLRFTAAERNAQQRLQGEQTNLSRSQMISEDDIRRRQMALAGWNAQSAIEAQRENALINAMLQLNRPLSYSQSSQTGGGSSVAYGQYGGKFI